VEQFASASSIMASLNNVAQRILGVRRDMIVPHKAGALSGVMVASAEPMKTMRILTMKKWWFNHGDDFFSIYMRSLLRVC
jgi:hypothetical protein